jgi:N-acetylneuraminate synthase
MRFAKPFIIAELSGEHRGQFTNALTLIRAAKDAGADAAKLQCFDPERLAERRGGKDKVLSGGLWDGRNLLDLYRETHTPREWFPKLFEYGRDIGIQVFSSVFDVKDIEFLETLGCPAYKISAMEAGDGRLIMSAADTGKPIVISLPGKDIPELPDNDISYLHCVSRYPCKIEEAMLHRIRELHRALPSRRIGFSDHTPGIEAAVSAVKNYNAQIIEKHITLSRSNGGPDAAFSLEPDEFRQMVEAIHA